MVFIRLTLTADYTYKHSYTLLTTVLQYSRTVGNTQ